MRTGLESYRIHSHRPQGTGEPLRLRAVYPEHKGEKPMLTSAAARGIPRAQGREADVERGATAKFTERQPKTRT